MKIIYKIALIIVIFFVVAISVIMLNYNKIVEPYNVHANSIRQAQAIFYNKNNLEVVENTTIYYGEGTYYISIASDGNTVNIYVHDAEGNIIFEQEYDNSNYIKLEEKYSHSNIEYGYEDDYLILRVKNHNDKSLIYAYYLYDTLEQYKYYEFN